MKSPSYSEIKQLLKNAIQALPVADAPVLPGEILAWTRQIPFHEIHAADAACLLFAQSRQWPRMSNTVLAQIHLRLDCAVSICQSMPMPLPGLELEDALEMLLFQLWHEKGLEWVALTYSE